MSQNLGTKVTPAWALIIKLRSPLDLPKPIEWNNDAVASHQLAPTAWDGHVVFSALLWNLVTACCGVARRDDGKAFEKYRNSLEAGWGTLP